MKNIKSGLASFLVSFLLLSCVTRTPPGNAKAGLPPNVQTFSVKYEKLWDALVNVVQYRLLLPMEFSDTTKGQFITKQVSEENGPATFRYRLTGRVEPGHDGLVVTLYKDQQVFQNNRWTATPSDSILERQIFKMLKEDLVGH